MTCPRLRSPRYARGRSKAAVMVRELNNNIRSSQKSPDSCTSTHAHLQYPRRVVKAIPHATFSEDVQRVPSNLVRLTATCHPFRG